MEPAMFAEEDENLNGSLDEATAVDDHDEDGPDEAADPTAEPPVVAGEPAKPKLTGKQRAMERAANHRALEQQNVELRRQMAEMAGAVTANAQASRLAAEVQARQAASNQRPWEEVADERVARAAAAIKEGDPATVAAYHRTVREVAQEGARREAAAIQREAEARQPRQLTPQQQEWLRIAPWLDDPTHRGGVTAKMNQLMAAQGLDPNTVSPRVYDAKVKEAIAHYANFVGLEANLPRPAPGNPGAVAGAGARSFGGGAAGGGGAPDSANMPEFMRDLADQMYSHLPPQKRYATYIKQVVNPELQRQRERSR